MNELVFHDQEVTRTVSGRRRTLLVRTPSDLANDPAVFFALAADRRRCFEESSYWPLVEPLLRAGHRVASFDLPNHGDLVDRYGEGLTGMAAAIAAGVDVFASVATTGQAMADLCIERGWGRDGRIGVAGISRGALCALNWLAEDRRVSALAAFAPVTDLPTLKEFAELADSPIVQRRNALALVPSLVGRPIFITIPRNDPRVGTDNCLRFYDALRARESGVSNVVFEVTEGNEHSVPPDGYHRGARWLIDTVAPPVI